MMKKPLILASTLLALTTSSIALAKKPTFKVAIIENTTASDEIISGKFEQSLSELKQNPSDLNTSFEHAMSLCVVNIKLNKFDNAEQHCSEAVNVAQTLSEEKTNSKLVALAYNNRAIARALSEDNFGALDDFTSAVLLNHSSLINNNLSHFKKQYIAKIEL